MSVRIFHSADWHLGHSLHGVSREFEHQRFLDWLLDRLEERQVDAMLVAGDLFDSANPPASAQAMLYRFVVAAQRRLPGLELVLIAGNHDSPARLEAPGPILDALRVRVVGSVTRDAMGRLETERLLVPLHDRRGEVAAWCAAVPFLRPADLRSDAGDGEDPLVEGVTQLYAEALAALEPHRNGLPLVALGHLYLVGGRLSELSERKILGGNQHALPAAIFPDQVSYAALGHLHLAQAVGGREQIRYSGSPIPLASDERTYPHQILAIDLDAEGVTALESLPVPRFVDILRVPEQGQLTPEAAEAALESHPFATGLPPDQYPYLEVAVHLAKPDPGLRRRIEAAVDGKPVRLLKLTPHYAGGGGGFTSDSPAQRLTELHPDGVFCTRYRQQYGSEPAAELLAAFHSLAEAAQGAEP
jgi:exonuclease SbcD